jgi:hypothetical protein
MNGEESSERKISDAKILKALTNAFIIVTYILVFLKVLFW